MGYVKVRVRLGVRVRLYHEDTSVAVSVDSPQFKISLGLDGCGSGSPVDQGQLPETASFSDTGHPLAVHIHLQKGQGKE